MSVEGLLWSLFEVLIYMGIGIILYEFVCLHFSRVELTNGYWVDKNDNRWKCELYTRSQAVKYSKSMKGCYGCDDSHDCEFCMDCINIDNCEKCTDSHLCSYCIECKCCYWCSACTKCKNCEICKGSCGCCYNKRTNICIDCEGCYDCYDCKNCIDGKWLYHCINYNERPRMYATKKMEYRDLSLYFYCDDYNDLQIVCGRENYNLITFETKFLKLVQKNEIDIAPYQKELEKAKILFEIEDKVVF